MVPPEELAGRGPHPQFAVHEHHQQPRGRGRERGEHDDLPAVGLRQVSVARRAARRLGDLRELGEQLLSLRVAPVGDTLGRVVKKAASLLKTGLE